MTVEREPGRLEELFEDLVSQAETLSWHLTMGPDESLTKRKLAWRINFLATAAQVFNLGRDVQWEKDHPSQAANEAEANEKDH